MYNSHTDIWIAGAFAAVVVDFIVYPFDTLKTRIQSPNYERVFKDARTGAVKRNILFKGLYQGVWSVVFSTIPSSGAFFTTYEAVKYAFYNSSTNPESHGPLAQKSRSTISLPFTHSLPTPIIHAIASSSGEMVSCLMLTPAEVLKQNAQMVNKSQTGGHHNNNAMRHVLSKFKSHPWRLWSGYTALVGRNLPFTGLQFPLFEYIRSHMIDWRRKRRHSNQDPSVTSFSSSQREAFIERAGLTGLSAAASGTVSSFVTTPIDVVKTRVMLSATDDVEGGDRGSKNRPLKKGTLDVGREIFRKEGARGLFKGGAIRSGWTAVSLSLYLSLYEGGRMFLEDRRRNLEGVGGATEEGDLNRS
ncbi:hypothetical protein N7456_002144 [Penicillium angulare]|uniref:Mitochondrial thiamine pyrophosphate carrier 1 n=1 Tax=Penicillium angulare TaxID=116970 RepID=A0A9W9KPJ6_9EURO|nr:hypothetical protein N7456_002144 [Penicillium angulare]